MKIKVENKATVLSETLKEFFGDKMNLERIKFFGNSSIQERIDLMERFVRLFGSGSIECLLADKEFVEDK
jgi:hypothetical protein